LRECQSFRRVNIWGSRELSFFLPVDKVLDYAGIESAISLLKTASATSRMDEIEAVFDRFANHFAETAGTDLALDDEENAVWRTTMFCRLYDITNTKWIPGPWDLPRIHLK